MIQHPTSPARARADRSARLRCGCITKAEEGAETGESENGVAHRRLLRLTGQEKGSWSRLVSCLARKMAAIADRRSFALWRITRVRVASYFTTTVVPTGTRL